MVMVTIDTIILRDADVAGNAQSSNHHGSGLRGPVWRLLKNIGTVRGRLKRWQVTRRTRKDLTDLDTCLLRDIGISRDEARLEMRKSIYLHWTAELLPPHHHAPIKFPML
ncbi:MULTISPECIES: DUF1127 domain-containing protein [Rhizobium/Agrobacterium group]|uniref:DUF1127 domain-containing protein n=2 Tax=Rhizobium/Agrobacterium group TaxID=227290 RepID=UPI000B3FC083|nr:MULTISPECIES: DUF1127 domain-containing protein [Rhizobium/Agrobacterium group]MCF1481724.1 DUF1127 domain-containing protein [Allorhizobium ampelinum]MCF1494748.1 DUF1127 domain-containing protein [Allorhizobium ampelinum]MVA45118.1 DUF1127 domain-containing protein [Agrobacterium vitis]MVA50740.1 DUF1127 domain-containing protein [Agrobacterium vitis]OVE95519.1 hypothetical protein B7W85_06830 [Allorhizobium ampelinum]